MRSNAANQDKCPVCRARIGQVKRVRPARPSVPNPPAATVGQAAASAGRAAASTDEPDDGDDAVSTEDIALHRRTVNNLVREAREGAADRARRRTQRRRQAVEVLHNLMRRHVDELQHTLAQRPSEEPASNPTAHHELQHALAQRNPQTRRESHEARRQRAEADAARA
eukprot:1203327-Prymnesium_polylepis.1